MTHYDENFGHWQGDMNDPDLRAFYDHVQKTSVEKVCVDCGRTVKIMPDYECCDSCATIREQGGC